MEKLGRISFVQVTARQNSTSPFILTKKQKNSNAFQPENTWNEDQIEKFIFFISLFQQDFKTDDKNIRNYLLLLLSEFMETRNFNQCRLYLQRIIKIGFDMCIQNWRNSYPKLQLKKQQYLLKLQQIRFNQTQKNNIKKYSCCVDEMSEIVYGKFRQCSQISRGSGQIDMQSNEIKFVQKENQVKQWNQYGMKSRPISLYQKQSKHWQQSNNSTNNQQQFNNKTFIQNNQIQQQKNTQSRKMTEETAL